ncbi:MAG: ATP-binding cassette domain-containing protein [Ezakiella sp.]|nr:ATP-binding cassette domain-containing protein [Ezakiella sp.]MDD7472334.1 ATP-binding cassette domain-containing protein [Bacillota bacterium]MDY3923071.1 ATP-binding cassette domain-containing protein [Ezakiella sp.]
MNLVKATEIQKRFFNNVLFSGANFTIKEGRKYALKGQNGSGKTTLLKIISGEMEVDDGELFINDATSISSQSQFGFSLFDMEVNDIIDLFSKKMTKLLEDVNEGLKAIEENYDEKTYLKYLSDMELFEKLCGNDYFKTRDEFIKIFGLDKFLNRKYFELSGGQMQYVRLSVALFETSNLVLLDEPTNYLDKEKTDWLINYIKNSQKSFLIVSHDDDFLEKVVDGYIVIKNKTIKQFMGTKVEFEEAQESLYERELQENRTVNNEIKRLDAAIKETIRKRDRAAIPHVHVVLLERLRREKKAMEKKLHVFEVNREINFKQLDEAGNSAGTDFISIKNVSKKYGENIVFRDLSLRLNENAHTLILGENGIGKSTLLKLISNEIKPDSGKIDIGNLNIKLIEQMVTPPEEDMKLKKYVSEVLKIGESGKKILKKEFYFEDIWDNNVSTLSGGELRRLEIAASLLASKNIFLILDEPTTHLDSNVKLALINLINSYNGGLICVSHDEELINNFVGNIYIMKKENGKTKINRI